MKVTLADVAKRANVSTCTVSRVLNNKHRNKVGEETRQRVLKARRNCSTVRTSLPGG